MAKLKGLRAIKGQCMDAFLFYVIQKLLLQTVSGHSINKHQPLLEIILQIQKLLYR